MSKCDVEVRLDGGDPTYHPGDRIRGSVHVRANGDVDYRRIVLVHEWRTHGRGNRDRGSTQELELDPGGHFRAGDTLSLPFDVEAARGPFTYHGHYLNVDWYLEARVDVALSRDPKAEREIVLAPGEQPLDEYSFGDAVVTRAGVSGAALERKHQEIAKRVAGVVVIMLVVVGSVLLLRGSGLIGGSPGFGAIFGVALLAVGGAVGFHQWRNVFARRRLGAITLDVQPRHARPGEEVRVRVRSPHVADATVERATVVLEAKEVVVRGSGTDRTTHTEQLYEIEAVLVDMPRAVRDGPLEISGVTIVPSTAPFSFRATDNRLQWELTVRLALPGWPDWVEKLELIVRP